MNGVQVFGRESDLQAIVQQQGRGASTDGVTDGVPAEQERFYRIYRDLQQYNNASAATTGAKRHVPTLSLRSDCPVDPGGGAGGTTTKYITFGRDSANGNTAPAHHEWELSSADALIG